MEEQRHDTIDKLGGTSRIAKLEAEIDGLKTSLASLQTEVTEGLMKIQSIIDEKLNRPKAFVPGAIIRMDDCKRDVRFVCELGFGSGFLDDGVLLAYGADWAVIKSLGGIVYLACGPGVIDHLKAAVK